MQYEHFDIMTIKLSLSHTVQVPKFASVGEKYGKYTHEAPSERRS